MSVYTASYYVQFQDRKTVGFRPDVSVVLGGTVSDGLFFTLSKKAMVRMIDPPSSLPSHLKEPIQWGELREALEKPLKDPSKKDFKVEVLEETWFCFPDKIERYVISLRGRRNRLARELRREIKKLGEKLEALEQIDQPAEA